MDVETGFLGYVKFNEEPSVILVTNCHVLCNEEMAAKSSIEFEGINVQLRDVLVETSYMSSPKKKVCIQTMYV